MADVKISQLSAASTLTGTEIVPVVQSSTTVRTTAQAIANLAPSTGVPNSWTGSSASQFAGTASFASTVRGSIFTGANIAASASFATTASYVLGGGGAAFPYIGSAQISGSLGVTGSVNVTSNLKVDNLIRAVDLTSIGNIYPGVAAYVTPVKYNGNDFNDYYQSQFPSLQPYNLNSYSTSAGGTTFTVRTGHLGIGTYVDVDFGTSRKLESIYLYVSQSTQASAPLNLATSTTKTIISDNNTLVTPFYTTPTVATLDSIATANGRLHVLTVTGSMLARDGVSLGTNINNTHFITGSTAITGSVTIDSILKLQRRTTTPTSPEEGMIIASGSAGASVLYYYNGSTWNALF
jgi:hypothetical protein